MGSANSITNFELAKEYVRNNKRIKYFKFFVRAYQIPHLEFVSHAAFECAEIAKPFIYLYYLEQYASTAYLDTYLDFFMVTQSITVSESASESASESTSESVSDSVGMKISWCCIQINVDSLTVIDCVTIKKSKYVSRYAVLAYCSK